MRTQNNFIDDDDSNNNIPNVISQIGVWGGQSGHIPYPYLGGREVVSDKPSAQNGDFLINFNKFNLV